MWKNFRSGSIKSWLFTQKEEKYFLFLDSNDPAYFLEGKRVSPDPSLLCKQILFTCYMGSKNSSQMTRDLAAGLAQDINANHSRYNFSYIFYIRFPEFDCVFVV